MVLALQSTDTNIFTSSPIIKKDQAKYSHLIFFNNFYFSGYHLDNQLIKSLYFFINFFMFFLLPTFPNQKYFSNVLETDNPPPDIYKKPYFRPKNTAHFCPNFGYFSLQSYYILWFFSIPPLHPQVTSDNTLRHSPSPETYPPHKPSPPDTLSPGTPPDPSPGS